MMVWLTLRTGWSVSLRRGYRLEPPRLRARGAVRPGRPGIRLPGLVSWVAR
jgi:hypothetical protein